MRFIDVHCHLNYRDYGDLDGLLKRVTKAGVEKVICAGFDVQSSALAREISERYDCVYFTAGIQPTETKGFKASDLDEIARLAESGKCVAVGEIGLDYHYPDTDKLSQAKAFKLQIELAESLALPVQIHSRDCAEDMLEIIKEFAPHLKHGVTFHCFSHSPEIAAELEKIGAYFSFGGTSTYNGSKKVRRALSFLAEDRIMTETDSPYLPPLSKCRVFPNTPESIPEICENMAKLKGKSLEEMSETVWANAHKFFKKLC